MPFVRGFACISTLVLGTWCLAADWPQWQGPDRDGVWREGNLITSFPKSGPKVLWRIPIGPGNSGPAVSQGKVYVMDRIPEKDKDGKPVTKGKSTVLGKERVLCLDAQDGKTLWKQEYDCPYTIQYNQGPRTTPCVVKDLVYTLGAMGHVHAYRAQTGEIVWAKDLTQVYGTKPPLWGYAASLLVDGDQLITLAGGKGSAVVSLDRHTGKELWKSLSAEEVGYCPPAIHEIGGKRQLLVWLDSTVQGLDVKNGTPLWSFSFPDPAKLQRPVVNIAPPVQDGQQLFLSEFYQGSILLDLPGEGKEPKAVWRTEENNPAKPADLNSIMTRPIIKGDYIYGIGGSGEMRCLEKKSGKVVWESLTATGGKKALFAHAFIIPQGDRYVLFNDQGDLILAEMDPKGYREISKAHVLDTTFTTRGRNVVWCYPAFAGGRVYLHNDKEMICVSLATSDYGQVVQ